VHELPLVQSSEAKEDEAREHTLVDDDQCRKSAVEAVQIELGSALGVDGAVPDGGVAYVGLGLAGAAVTHTTAAPSRAVADAFTDNQLLRPGDVKQSNRCSQGLREH
jgi:hypothetical protein